MRCKTRWSWHAKPKQSGKKRQRTDVAAARRMVGAEHSKIYELNRLNTAVQSNQQSEFEASEGYRASIGRPKTWKKNN
eukprot:753625-Hanusia_phi.AAC.1